MSHTNKTTHYNLPQFIGTDKPGWLTDVNQGYQDIDEAIYQADSAAQGAQVTADSANSAIQTVNADLQTAKTQLDTTTTVANQAQATNVTQGQQIATNATGITNINARLGNKDISAIGDGTITGAIEAIEQGSGGGELADDVTQAGTSAVKSSGIYSFVNGRTGGLTFGQDSSGNWGYKVGGADPVIPFKSGMSGVATSGSGFSTVDDDVKLVQFYSGNEQFTMGDLAGTFYSASSFSNITCRRAGTYRKYLKTGDFTAETPYTVTTVTYAVGDIVHPANSPVSFNLILERL